MRKFLVMLLMMLGLAVCAKEQDVFVLPLFMTNSQNYNSYGFETVSEIVANDVIQNFLIGNKINTTRLSAVKALNETSPILKEIGNKYRKTGLIDFEKLTELSKKNPADKTLLVASYVEDSNGGMLDAWDVLKFATDFGIDYPYVLVTKVILLDNVDGVALWQKSYSLPLTSKNAAFTAQNYTKALEQYEKVHSYSKNIISKDVEQNLILRLNPKSIDFASQVKKNPNGEEGIGLKYYKKGIPVKITQPKETFEEQLLKDDSFSL